MRYILNHYVKDVEHASGVPRASPPTRYLPQIQYEGFESTPFEDVIDIEDDPLVISTFIIFQRPMFTVHGCCATFPAGPTIHFRPA